MLGYCDRSIIRKMGYVVAERTTYDPWSNRQSVPSKFAKLQ